MNKMLNELGNPGFSTWLGENLSDFELQSRQSIWEDISYHCSNTWRAQCFSWRHSFGWGIQLYIRKASSMNANFWTGLPHVVSLSRKQQESTHRIPGEDKKMWWLYARKLILNPKENPTARAIGSFIQKHASTAVHINIEALSTVTFEEMKEEVLTILC